MPIKVGPDVAAQTEARSKTQKSCWIDVIRHMRKTLEGVIVRGDEQISTTSVER